MPQVSDISRSLRLRLMLETVAIIAGCEGAIMLVLPLLVPAGSSDLIEAIIDTTLLTALSGPLLFWRFTGYHRAQKIVLLAEIEQRSSAIVQINRELENQKFAFDQHSIVAVTDIQGRITYANDRFCSISGYSREELLGQNHRMLKSGIHSPELFREMWSTIARGRVWHGEVCNRAKEGHLYWVDATIVPLLGPDGKPHSYIAIRTDISNRKRAEGELHRAMEAADAANRAKSDFLATMSHEIRTPMNGVIGFTDILLDTELSAKQRKYLESLRMCGENLLVLINDILDFSKIEAGKLVLESAPFEIRRCAQDVVQLLEKSAREKGLGLTLGFSPEVPRWLLGDTARLRQIILNFVGNAVKFTAQGEVRLEGRLESAEHGLQLRMDCIDTGIGLTLEQQAKLFQKFTQGDSTTTRKFGGTGLGLAICKSIVEAMGGKIGVSSAAGKGSTFWFTIPVRIPDAAPANLAGQRAVAAMEGLSAVLGNRSIVPSDRPVLPGDGTTVPLAAPCILVVDDIESNCVLSTSILQSLGYRTETAANGQVAVELAAQHSFAVILMDYHMPVLDGCDAAVAVRSREGPNQRTPIVGLSASVDDRDHCLKIGMNAFLPKPVRRADLKRVLEEVTRERVPSS